MALFGPFQELTPAQRHTYFASLAGWSLDAFDFFIFVLCLTAIFALFCKAKTEGEWRWRSGKDL